MTCAAAVIEGGELVPDSVESRVAAIQQQLHDWTDDLRELKEGQKELRSRMHKVEGVTDAYLETQKINRQREENQYRRLGNKIAIGSLAIAGAMLILAIVTLIYHS